MAITNASTLAEYASGISTQGATLTVDQNNKRVGIGTTNPQAMLQVGTGVTVFGNTGIVSFTSLKLSGDTDSTSVSTGALTVTGGVGIGLSLTVGGDVSVGGTITYEDVTNVDSLGIVTARSGLRVVGGGVTCVGVATFFNDVLVGRTSVIDNARLTIAKSAAGFTTAIALHNGDGTGSKIISTRSLVLGADADSNTGTDGSLIAFETNATEKVRIDSDGDVGIGTVNPDGQLHVVSSSAGSVTAAGDANDLVLESSTNVGMSLLTANNSLCRIKFGDPDATNAGVIVYSHANDSLQFQTNATEAMRIDSSGQMGLGITPVKKFNVVAGIGSTEVIRLSQPVDANAQQNFGIGWCSNNSHVWPGAQITSLEYDVSDTRRGMLFYTRGTNQDIAPTERMRITHDGKVGIGITNPDTSLHVANDNSPAQGANYAALSLGSPTHPLRKVEIGAIRSYAAADYDNVGIAFKVHTSNTETDDPELQMILDYDGRLGIGTSNPQSRIHLVDDVAGSASNPIIRLDRSDNYRNNWIGLASADELVIAVDDANAGGSSNFRVKIDGTEKLRIQSNGNVGVGTDTANFTSFGSNTGGIEISNVNNNNALLVQSGTNEFYFAASSSANYIYGDDDAPIIIATNDTERLRIHEDGAVLIGTTDATTIGSPDVHVVIGSTTNNHEAALSLNVMEGTNGRRVKFFLDDDDGVYGIDSTASTGVPPFVVRTSATERLRITSGGQVSISSDGSVESDFAITNKGFANGVYTEVASIPNDTNVFATEIKSVQDSKQRTAKLGVRKATGENASGFVYWHQRDGGHSWIYTDNSNVLRLSNSVSNVGAASGTIVGTQTSDIRLKNNLGNVSYGLTEINAINPIKFTMKKDTTRQRIGFSAQDVKTIIPEAVYDTKDTVEIDGSNVEDVLAMEYVALIPVLVNAVKQLSAKVTALESA